MEKMTDIRSVLYQEVTLQKLKDYGLFSKGSSKSFTIFLILWFLSKEELYGYQLMKKIDEFFLPQINYGLMKKTKANKIYPILKQLTEHKLIKFHIGTHNFKKVKIYELTTEGLKTLNLIKISYKENTKRKIWKELYYDLIS